MSLLDYITEDGADERRSKTTEEKPPSSQPPSTPPENNTCQAISPWINEEIKPPATPYARQWRVNIKIGSPLLCTVSLTNDGKWSCTCRHKSRKDENAECRHIRDHKPIIYLEEKRAKENAMYTVAYILNVVQTDPYVLDIRSWPNGITEDEVKKRYESDEWNTQSGHFNFLMRHHYKQKGGTLKTLWATIRTSRETSWRQFVNWSKSEIKKFTELKARYAKEQAEAVKNEEKRTKQRKLIAPGETAPSKDTTHDFYDRTIADDRERIETYTALLNSLRNEGTNPKEGTH
jgi:hypothetical protein